jgi:hypothetical protein
MQCLHSATLLLHSHRTHTLLMQQHHFSIFFCNISHHLYRCHVIRVPLAAQVLHGSVVAVQLALGRRQGATAGLGAAGAQVRSLDHAALQHKTDCVEATDML